MNNSATALAPTPQGQPMFSIIIPTRNRPALLARAIRSVLAQDFKDHEIIVVDDGGTDSLQLEDLDLPASVQVHRLLHTARGHGPAYSRNFGVDVSKGRYLCFLDDDDLWIDNGHLRRAWEAITSATSVVDLYFTDQRAVFPDGRVCTQPLWLSGIEHRLHQPSDAQGGYRIGLDALLQAPGFAHLNCSIYRRGLYESINGMDETLRYENDRDVYLRAVDAAQVILYNPAVVSQHHIPDASRANNVSTAVSQLEKKLFQLRICDKAIMHARHGAIRRVARQAKVYTLKSIAELLESSGRRDEAVYYMREALLVGFSFKWLAYTLFTAMRPRRVPRPA
jgi:glycosyltransferase involved in cell wall biosynthesis